MADSQTRLYAPKPQKSTEELQKEYDELKNDALPDAAVNAAIATDKIRDTIDPAYLSKSELKAINNKQETIDAILGSNLQARIDNLKSRRALMEETGKRTYEDVLKSQRQQATTNDPASLNVNNNAAMRSSQRNQQDVRRRSMQPPTYPIQPPSYDQSQLDNVELHSKYQNLLVHDTQMVNECNTLLARLQEAENAIASWIQRVSELESKNQEFTEANDNNIKEYNKLALYVKDLQAQKAGLRRDNLSLASALETCQILLKENGIELLQGAKVDIQQQSASATQTPQRAEHQSLSRQLSRSEGDLRTNPSSLDPEIYVSNTLDNFGSLRISSTEREDRAKTPSRPSKPDSSKQSGKDVGM